MDIIALLRVIVGIIGAGSALYTLYRFLPWLLSRIKRAFVFLRDMRSLPARVADLERERDALRRDLDLHALQIDMIDQRTSPTKMLEAFARRISPPTPPSPPPS